MVSTDEKIYKTEPEFIKYYNDEEFHRVYD
jgi:hypothetical protein